MRIPYLIANTDSEKIVTYILSYLKNKEVCLLQEPSLFATITLLNRM